MKKLTVSLEDQSYEITIGAGTLSMTGRLVRKHLRGDRCIVITDSNVMDLYGSSLKGILREIGLDFNFVVVEPGENTKTLFEYERICNRMRELAVGRKDLVVAFGGGVVGDLAGFVAATYLRGMDFIQVPTTLLAQVDSSVGSKVAVNLQSGKNYVGSFHQPKAVVVDTDLLKTLNPREFGNGIAEAIKYGCIWDEGLFKMLEEAGDRETVMESIDLLVYRCLSIKRDVVQQDEKEDSLRMILNFGHTLGHALEKYHGYNRYTHGEAVAVGMDAITRSSERLSLTREGTHRRLQDVLKRHGLPLADQVAVNREIIKLAELDKKGSGDMVSLVIVEEIGKAVIKRVSKQELFKYLSS